MRFSIKTLMVASAALMLANSTPAQILGQNFGAPPAPPPAPKEPAEETIEIRPVTASVPEVTWRWKASSSKPVRGKIAKNFDLVKDTPDFRDWGPATHGDSEYMAFGICRLVQDWMDGETSERLRKASSSVEGREKAMRQAHRSNDDWQHTDEHGRSAKKDDLPSSIHKYLKKDIQKEGFGYFHFSFTHVSMDIGESTLLAYSFEQGTAETDGGKVQKATRFLVYDPVFQADAKNRQGIEEEAYLLYLHEEDRFAFPRAYLQAYADAGITLQKQSTLDPDLCWAPFSLDDDGWTELLNTDMTDANLPSHGLWDWEIYSRGKAIQPPKAGEIQFDPQVITLNRKGGARQSD